MENDVAGLGLLVLGLVVLIWLPWRPRSRKAARRGLEK